MNRQEFEAIIKEINEAKCLSVHEVEDVCQLFCAAKPECVAKALNVDKHRWYEISTNVYKIDEWFLGVRGASDLFSEEMGWDDADVKSTAFEMERIPSYTYKQKK